MIFFSEKIFIIILQKVESIYFPWEQLKDINTWRRTYRSSTGGRLRLLRLFIPIIEFLERLFLLPSLLKWIARVWSNKIQREELVRGNHIYTWKRAHTYAHHGIYIGDGKVGHYTRGGSKKRIMFSSSPSHPSESTSAIGSDQSRLDYVVITNIDDFLSGGELSL